MDLFSLGKNAYSSIQYSEQIEYIKQAEKDCLIILFSATSSYFEYYDIRQWKDKIQRSNVWYIGSGAVPDFIPHSVSYRFSDEDVSHPMQLMYVAQCISQRYANRRDDSK